MNERIEALAARRLQWLNAIEDGDISTIIYFLTNDARLLLHGNVIKNSDAIHNWLKSKFEQYHCNWLLSQASRQVKNNRALEKGFFTLSILSKSDGKTAKHCCGYKILWQLTEKMKWRIANISIQSEKNIDNFI
jgi:ketosteroid isomerase-like protein